MNAKTFKLVALTILGLMSPTGIADPRLRTHLNFLMDTLTQMESAAPNTMAEAVAVDIEKIPDMKVLIQRDIQNLEAGREPSHLEHYYQLLPAFLQRKFRDRVSSFKPVLPGTRRELVTSEALTFALSRLGLTPYASEAEVRSRISKLASLNAFSKHENQQKLLEESLFQIREFQEASRSPDLAERHIEKQVQGWDSHADHLMFKINIDFERGMFWSARSFDKFADYLEAMSKNENYLERSVREAHGISTFSLPSRLQKLAFRIGNDVTDAEASQIREKIYRVNRNFCLAATSYASKYFNRGFRWDPPAWLVGMSILNSTSDTIEDTLNRIKNDPHASRHLLDGIIFTFETLGETQVNLYSHEGTKMVEKFLELVDRDAVTVSWGKKRLMSYLVNKIQEHKAALELTPQVLDHPNLSESFQGIRQKYSEAAQLGGAAAGLVGLFTCPQLQSSLNRVRSTCEPKTCYIKRELSIGSIDRRNLQTAESVARYSR
jgi:hypothetical protein